MKTDSELNKELLRDLVSAAEADQHRQFKYITNWQEYSNTRKIRRAHILLVSSIRTSIKKLLKKYCKAVERGESDVIQLLAYSTLLNVLEFYEEELRILTAMIYEYDSYLMDGNFINAWLFLEPRPDNELWDRRC